MRLAWKLFASVISVSLVAVSSTAAAAPTPQAPSDNAWLALSMLTPSGAAALGTAGVAAAQPDSIPPPPPPPSDYAGPPPTPPLPVIAVWLSVLITDIYILTRHHHGGPNSPA